MKRISKLEETFALQIRGMKLLPPQREYAFCEGRKWRFDFAWPLQRVAVEIEGGVWAPGGGGHNRGAAFVKNLEKYNTAALMGWRLFRFHEGTVYDGTAVAFVAPLVAKPTYSPGVI